MKADLVLYNAKIYTIKDQSSGITAVAVKDGNIVALMIFSVLLSIELCLVHGIKKSG